MNEAQLEEQFIRQLENFGYERVKIADEAELKKNLKKQLEKFNQTTFSEREFSHIYNELSKGGVFEKAKLLRDRVALRRDNGEDTFVKFFDSLEPEKNIFQVANQITIQGKYENRYDVTLLVNGFPVVQVELKRRGVEVKEAFNQVKRYQRHSYPGTLFEFIQIFIISNQDEVKYFANNSAQSYAQTFFWTDEENHKISDLAEFAEAFLKPNFLASFVGEYIVTAEAYKIPMVLRPYQYYAVKAIEKRVKETNEGGYIWHTTGSGKTLTSFKTSQVLRDLPEVKKLLLYLIV